MRGSPATGERRASPGRAAFVAALAIAWASAGPRPFVEAAQGVPSPIDFARDYVTAHAHLHGAAGALMSREAQDAYARSIGVPRVVLLAGPYHAHPPPALLPVLPLAALSFGGAALAWFALSLVALGVLAFTLVSLATRSPRPPGSAVAAAFVALALWPPVVHNLAKGQWSILLAALIAAGWAALERGRARTAGVLIGVAASLKATPVVLLGYLALRHRRAAWAMAATLGAAAVTSLALFGVEPWRAFILGARPNALAWQTWTANTVSLNGLFARLFAGSAFARPLFEAPGLAQALTLAATFALLALIGVRTRAAAGDQRRLFAAWAAFVVLANPLAWTHTAVMALLPFVLLEGAAPAWLRAAAIVTLTVPRETLAALAGPMPVAPGRGLVLSAHALAVLALVALGVSLVARAPDRERSPAPP